jgi:hypothetical protein
MISTKNLAGLATIETLRRLTQSLAMLDAVVEREWEYRYYCFNSNWAVDEQMASMRNGQGDSWYCVFGTPGVFLKGFDHESPMSPWSMETPRVWLGVMENIPEAFKAFATEPAFSMQDTTYCLWRGVQDSEWRVGNIAYPDGEDPDGSGWMLSILEGNPKTYRDWAEEYFERPISLSAVEQIYEYRALTPKVVRELNPKIDFASILADASEIGFPVAQK